MTETERILDAANFMYERQRYIDSEFVAKATGIPKLIVENVLKNNGFKPSHNQGQFIKGGEKIEF